MYLTDPEHPAQQSEQPHPFMTFLVSQHIQVMRHAIGATDGGRDNDRDGFALVPAQRAGSEHQVHAQIAMVLQRQRPRIQRGDRPDQIHDLHVLPMALAMSTEITSALANPSVSETQESTSSQYGIKSG